MTDSTELALGWKEIADRLGVSVRSAQERAGRDTDPLPVRVGHRGPWIHVTSIRDWMERQDMPYQTARKLRDLAQGCVVVRRPSAKQAE